MPEGPEVRTIVEYLRGKLKNSTLLDIKFIGSGVKFNPQEWSGIKSKFPSSCLDIICIGKQIFMFFANEVAFNSTLALEGRWFYFDTSNEDDKLRYEHYLNKNYAKMVFFFNIGESAPHIVELIYDDKLAYGNFTIMNWAKAKLKMESIGIDMLANNLPICNIHPVVANLYNFNRRLTLDVFTKLVKDKRRRNTEITKFLMDQTKISGIGNYLKCEILYVSKIHPCRILGSLSDWEITSLYSAINNIIVEAYTQGGLTHSTFKRPDMDTGHFKAHVYKKDVDEFNNTVNKIKTKDGRSTYFVSKLQV